MKFHPEAQPPRLLIGQQDGSALLWDVEGARELIRFGDPHARVVDVGFSADGRLAIVSLLSGKIQFFDLASGQMARELAAASGLRSMALSADGKRLAVGGDGGQTRIFELTGEGGSRLLPSRASRINCVKFSPDGSRLFSADSDGNLSMWETTTWHPVRVIQAHQLGARDLAVWGGVVATGGADRMVKLFDHRRGEEVARLPEHAEAVIGLALSPDGRRLVSGGSDGTMRLWDVESSALLLSFSDSNAGARRLAFSPCGRWLATGYLDGTLWVRDGGGPALGAP